MLENLRILHRCWWACLLCGCHAGEPFALQDNSDSLCVDPCDAPQRQAQLRTGFGFTCVLKESGAVTCWGQGEYGVLGPQWPEGNGDAARAGHLDFGREEAVVQIATGWHHACALFDDQSARCWGRNDAGQLGLGNTEDYGDDPSESLADLDDLPLQGIASISAGVRNTCAIVGPDIGAAGQVHCWGGDQAGALGDARSGGFGDDEPIDATRPVALPAEATQVATGSDAACALLTTGAVHCWGDNWAGTLGIADRSCNVGNEVACVGGLGASPDIPVLGLGNRTVVSLSMNQTSACVVDNTGGLQCWGRNSQSRLGYPDILTGEFLDAPPGKVDLGSGTVVTAVALGVRHGCALDADGKVFCYGERGAALGYGMEAEEGVAGIGGTQSPGEAYAQRDNDGAVDLGDFDDEEGPDRALDISAGADMSCALMANGDVRCWGANSAGELGYGSASQVGPIGAQGSPAAVYTRLDRPNALTR